MARDVQSLPWYAPRADVKDEDLSAIATANVAELKQRAEACRRTAKLPPADAKLVEAWLAKLAKGTPEVPALDLDVSTNPPETLTVAAMSRRLIGNKDSFRGRRAQVSMSEPSDATKAALPHRKLHAIRIADGGECTGEEDECGGTTFTLVVDDAGTLVAIEEQMSACPMVYSLLATPVFEGEILRNLDRPSLEQTQTLAVTPQCPGIARYRIAEEKPEVTSLDSVALVVDGVELVPDACAAAAEPYCTNDGVALQLARGEHLDLAFTIPSGAACGSAELRANGHYVPTARSGR